MSIILVGPGAGERGWTVALAFSSKRKSVSASECKVTTFFSLSCSLPPLSFLFLRVFVGVAERGVGKYP